MSMPIVLCFGITVCTVVLYSLRSRELVQLDNVKMNYVYVINYRYLCLQLATTTTTAVRLDGLVLGCNSGCSMRLVFLVLQKRSIVTSGATKSPYW